MTTTEQQEHTIGLKQEIKVISAISKCFLVSDKPITEKDTQNKNIACYDPANVMAIEGISDNAKNILRRFVDCDFRELPKLDDYEKGYKSSVKISSEYLTYAINILKCVGDAIEISTANEYPITLKDDCGHFRIVIAPRIEADF
jgi:hypothetical protein